MRVRGTLACAVWVAATGCADPVQDLRADLGDPRPGDSRPERRLAAIVGLGAMGPAAAAAVPQLLACLDDESACDATVWALSEIGSGASLAVPALLARLDDGGSPMRTAGIVIALGKIAGGHVDARRRLEAMVTSPHVVVRQAVRGALRNLR